jgi:hypothetical protein
MVFFGLVCAVGWLIGLYWSVFALFPITAVMALGCCAVALSHGDSALSGLHISIIAAFSLQGGYMIGLTSRDLVGHFISRVNAVRPPASN